MEIVINYDNSNTYIGKFLSSHIMYNLTCQSSSDCYFVYDIYILMCFTHYISFYISSVLVLLCPFNNSLTLHFSQPHDL